MSITELALRYVGLPPAEPLPFGPVTGATVMVVAGGGVLLGWAVEETTGAAGSRLVVGDGNVNGVQRAIAPLTFAAGESRVDYLPGAGVVFTSGLVVTGTAGTTGGVLYVVLLTPEEQQALMIAGLYGPADTTLPS